LPTDHRKELAKIRSFTQLIAYLRDEMGWRISRDSFVDEDDLFYDFTPEELGIDRKNAAKIQEIKRLRPLSTNQPFGIFFVKFEPKQLPVGALRRILSGVALKKRASANSADRAAWSADDLLFVSNYGEGETRQISFAHFSQKANKKDLPTLKVLGWNNLDTALHLDDVADKLTQSLSWPDDEGDTDQWREKWRSAFTLEHRETINTSKKLSVELAKLARNIRDRLNTVLAIETEDGRVSKLMAAFRKSLVHDLDEDGFADMYAQTIAYGLLSARVTNPAGDTADGIAAAMPVTNPFLKELMETFLDVGGRKGSASDSTGLDFDELGVGDVVELLDAANMEAVVRDFGDRNPQEDPVIHFYELFLTEYDAKKRMQRGVFYTPRPVVSFMVRSVDEQLRKEFGLKDGLADTSTWGEVVDRCDYVEIPEGMNLDEAFVQILDPATGTGTFLVEVIDIIHKTMTEKWRAERHDLKAVRELWNEYVPKHLLTRLHGYELMMAPYAIAHMKIGLKLHETGYQFESPERARVYLTNSLESAHDFSGTLAFAIPALAHEAEAVNGVKQDQRFTVLIGNPPYSIMSANLSEDCRALVDIFRDVDGKRIVEKSAIVLERTLQDDYVKFYAFASRLLHSATTGILAFISNNTFLENINLRGMRCYMLDNFQTIKVLDLHGDADKREQTSEGEKDENVFEIKKGVTIFLALKLPTPTPEKGALFRTDILGTRTSKYSLLSENTLQTINSTRVLTKPDRYVFIAKDEKIESEFESGISIADLFLESATGIETGKDSILVDFDRASLDKRMRHFGDPAVGDKAVRELYDAEKGCGRKIANLRGTILSDPKYADRFVPLTFTPFDERIVFFRTDLINVHSNSVARHLLQTENICLIAMRQVVLDRPFSHVFVSRNISNNRCFYSTRGKAYMFPLMRVQEEGLELNAESVTPNYKAELGGELLRVASVGSRFSYEGNDLLYYVYSQLHSPEYRKRYGAQLKEYYPRVFIARSAALTSRLIEIGKELVALHLLESKAVGDYRTTVIGSGKLNVEKVTFADDTIWLDRSCSTGFGGVPERIWNFEIGGYKICQKWLKDRQAKGGKNPRPGRILSSDDVDHVQRFIAALCETDRIMGDIDQVVDKHGGWPGAFQCDSSNATSDVQEIRNAAEDSATYDNSSE